MSGQKEEEKGKGYFSLVSGASGFSLVGFGFISLIISLWFWSLSGLFVSLAVFIHGFLEVRFRKQALNQGRWIQVRKMAWNQLALAASISLYSLWHMLTADPDLLRDLLNRPLVQSALNLYPVEFRIHLFNALPRIITIFYLLVILVAWLGCGSTAFYYLHHAKLKRTS